MNGRNLTYLLVTVFFVGNWGACDACNQPPVAEIDRDETPWDIYVTAGTEVTLDGSESYDPDGSIEWYRWEVSRWNGSGYVSDFTIYREEPVCGHDFYGIPGSYLVKLDVEDDDDAWSYYSDDTHVLAVEVTIDDCDEYLAYGDAGEAEIDYTLEPEDGGFRRAVKLIVKDDGGETVKTVNLEDDLGSQCTTWDGTDDSEEPVEPGEYTAFIQMGVGYGPSDYFSDSCTITVVQVTIDDDPPNRETDKFLQLYTGDLADVYYTIEPNDATFSRTVKLVVEDVNSTVVRTVTLDDDFGSQHTTWNGVCDDQQWAEPNEYTIKIEVEPNNSDVTISDSWTLFAVAAHLPIVTVVPVDLAGDDDGDAWGAFGWWVAPDLPDSRVSILADDPNIQLQGSYDQYNDTSGVLSAGGDSPGGPWTAHLQYIKEYDGPEPNVVMASALMTVYVTETVSHCPTGTSAAAWCSWPVRLGMTDSNMFRDQVLTQGFAYQLYDDEFSEDGCHGATLADYKGLSSFHTLHMVGPSEAWDGHVAFYADTNDACVEWIGGEQDMRVVYVPYPYSAYCVVVESEWLAANFDANDPNLAGNKAIAHWAQGGSASFMDAAGGRWRIGYSSATSLNECTDTTELLLTRMNGTDASAGALRTSGEAWAAGGFTQNTVMHGNGWTTLCPAPAKNDATWPESPPQQDGRYWGGIIFDTYIDGGQSADDALDETGGPIYNEDWGGTDCGDYYLGFEYEIENASGHGSVTADAGECTGGGKDMDGNRVADNGDDVSWQF